MVFVSVQDEYPKLKFKAPFSKRRPNKRTTIDGSLPKCQKKNLLYLLLVLLLCLMKSYQRTLSFRFED